MANQIAEEFIKQFGWHDYERIVCMGKPDRLSIIPDDLKKVAELLNALIKQNRIVTMDMENCVMFTADGVFGVDGDKLVIMTPR